MNPFMKTIKKIAAAYNGVSLILRIAIGLVVGVILALVCPGATWLKELGNLFVGALKGIAPVLVFVIVASALAQGSSKLDRRFGTVVWLYMLTTFVAAALSVVTSMLFPQTLLLAEAAEAEVIPQGLGEVMHTLLSNIVSNPISAIMNGNYIGILMWGCLFGVAMKKLGADSTKVFLSNTADAVSTIVRWIINLAPFGIMGLVNVVSNGLAIFTQYGKLLLLLVGTMLFMALVINPIIIFIYLRCNPYPLVFRCLRESGLTAFFTRSSAANIPVNMAMCEKLGLDAFDALVRCARTCRRFDESMRVPRELLLELAELAHLTPCGANAQRLRFHVVGGSEDCARVFDELAWAGALKDWSGPDEGERPTGYIAILAECAVPGKPAAPITEVDTGIAAQTMMFAARSATPEVAACMFKAFTPHAIDAMGLDNDKYELKLIMAFGVPAETQVIDAIDSNPDGSINYWRDEAQVHHVPKRSLADVLL